MGARTGILAGATAAVALLGAEAARAEDSFALFKRVCIDTLAMPEAVTAVAMASGFLNLPQGEDVAPGTQYAFAARPEADDFMPLVMLHLSPATLEGAVRDTRLCSVNFRKADKAVPQALAAWVGPSVKVRGERNAPEYYYIDDPSGHRGYNESTREEVAAAWAAEQVRIVGYVLDRKEGTLRFAAFSNPPAPAGGPSEARQSPSIPQGDAVALAYASRP